MKLNKKIIIVFLLWFILLNIFSIKNFIYSAYAKILESKWEYKKVEEISKKQDSLIWKYNLGVSLYKQKEYNKALDVFLSIFNLKKLNFDLDYNIWNSYYKVWVLEKDSKKKIDNWVKAISFYEKALDIRYDDRTKKNIEFILQKIKQERKKQAQKKNQENNKQNNNNNNNNNNNWKGQKNNSKKSNSWNWTNNNSAKNKGSKKSENKNSDSKENNSNKQGNSNKNKENDKKWSSNNKWGDKRSKNSNDIKNSEKNSWESKWWNTDSKKNTQWNKNNTENNKKWNNQQKSINQEQNKQSKWEENKSWLSNHDKQLLKAYQNRVAQSSQNLWDYYWKVYKEQSNPFDWFDNFFNWWSIFDNDEFWNNSNKKDW